MQQPLARFAAPVLLPLLLACGAEDTAAVSAVPFALYGAPGSGARACAGPAHRQFDFWLGEWLVRDGSGQQVGTNVITQDLDGCLVEESWTDQGGGRGRSLNAYDRQTGKWHQTWVADGLGHLRMSGGPTAADEMDLTGVRVSAASGAQLFDRYRWDLLPDGRVRQQGTLDIPALGLNFSFDGYYERRPRVVPVPAPGSANCQPGGRSAASRDLDFAVGRWRIESEGGLPLGQSDLTLDLSGCLFEEKTRSPLGHRARSFTYYDPVERRWYRTGIDNQAGRLEMQGALAGGRLVLTALAPDPVRMTLEAQGPDALAQRWEVSLDGGVIWRPALTLRYRRR